jgi:hypothetical protein
MRPILFFLLMFFSSLTMAQTIEDQYMELYLPWNEGELIYTEVVAAPDKSADQLYTLARLWISQNFKSGKDVLDIDDKSSGTLAGKGWSSIYVTSVGMPMEIMLWYRIIIEVKDGRYRYQIKDIEFENRDKTYGSFVNPAENWLSMEAMFRENGKIKPLNKQYYDRMIEVIERLEFEIRNQLTKPTLKDDW